MYRRGDDCQGYRISNGETVFLSDFEEENRAFGLLALNFMYATGKDVEQAIKNGADVNALDHRDHDVSVLNLAIRFRNEEAIKVLIENGANLTYRYFGHTPLDESSYNPPQIIRELKEKHADFIEAITQSGKTLQMDCRRGDMQRYVLPDGKIVSLKDYQTTTQKAKKESPDKKDNDRKEVVSILDKLNAATPTAARKAAKVAAVREYRKKHPKRSSRD